jgi:hypothetical protein
MLAEDGVIERDFRQRDEEKPGRQRFDCAPPQLSKSSGASATLAAMLVAAPPRERP